MYEGVIECACDMCYVNSPQVSPSTRCRMVQTAGDLSITKKDKKKNNLSVSPGIFKVCLTLTAELLVFSVCLNDFFHIYVIWWLATDQIFSENSLTIPLLPGHLQRWPYSG